MKRIFLPIILLVSAPAIAGAETIEVDGSSFRKIGNIEKNFRTHINEYNSNNKINQDFNVFSTMFRYKQDNNAQLKFGENGKVYTYTITDNEIFNEISKNSKYTPIFSNIGRNFCLKSQMHFFLRGNYSSINYDQVVKSKEILVSDYKKLVPGIIVDIFFPNIHNIRIEVPKKTVLLYKEKNESTHTLVDNKSESDYEYLVNIEWLSKQKEIYSENGNFTVQLGGDDAFITDKMCGIGIP